MSLFGCHKRQTIHIKGQLYNSKDSLVTFKQMTDGNSFDLDSVLIGKSGKFKFSTSSLIPEFYQIAFSNKNFITLLAQPGEHINLRFPSNHLAQGYEVSGSEGSMLIKDLDAHLRLTIRKLDSTANLYKRALNQPGFDSISKSLNHYYDSIVAEQKKYSIGFILDHLNSMASIKALYQKYDKNNYVLGEITDLQYMKLVADTLKVYYPESKHVKALVADLNTELTQYKLMKTSSLLKNAKTGLPDIALPDPNGDTLKLSSLLGKYVLLSFWVSVNQESVNENLNLKSIYHKYHAKGLEIYQVSLDKDLKKWIQAIQFDELPWINVIDSSYPDSPIVRSFNVNKIPLNYLIDKKGTVVNRDLDKRGLKIKLAQIFGY